MSAIYYQSAAELVDLMKAKEITPLELMEETIARVEAVNPALNAFVALRPEEALAEARALTEALAAGKPVGPLAGLPIGVKDLEDVAGMVTSYGSIPFQNNMAAHDSYQVERLKKAGAIVLGKTNTPEFGFTGFTRNRVFGVTRNPWNTDRTPGGSSGGSAAAVASGMATMATGSDGGGSTRIPAGYTGCYGIKTSVGRIPWGPSPILYQFRIAVNGPLTRTVKDAALFLDAAAGHHPADPDTLPDPGYSYVGVLEELPSKLRIAFSPDLGFASVEKDVAACAADAVKAFEDMGHTVELWSGSFPDVTDAWSRFMNLDTYVSLHKVLETEREELSRSFVAALDLARDVTAFDLIEAQKVRSELNQTMLRIFDQYDLFVTPTLPTEAFAAQGPPPSEIDGRVVPMLWAVAFTYPFNLSGHPAASVRSGLTGSGLPAGLQIVGPRLREDLVLQASRAFERARPWNDHWPEIG